MKTSRSMLSIRNLTKSYKTQAGRHYVFRNISVDFPENSNIGILGPNGAGKSTLLRILGGIDHPDSGSIICHKSISWPLGLRGGFVGNLNGRENCKLICNLYGLDSRVIQQKLGFIKELSGIGHYFEEPVKYYSSGMGSRIGFALSMAFDFEIVLIDEITSVGDRHFKDTAKQAIEDKRGRSNVIMVSHSMGNIRDFCDVGVLLKKGQLTVFDNLDEAVRAYLPQDEKKTEQATPKEDKLTLNLFSTSETDEVKMLRQHITGRLQQIEQAITDEDKPKNPGTFYHFLGICYGRLGNMTQAYQCHQKAVAETSDNPNFYAQLVAVALGLNLLEQAESALDKALQWWPENTALLSQKATLYTQQGRSDEALQCYEKTIVTAPDKVGIRNAFANALIMNGEFERAHEHCLAAINIDASNPTLFRTLSRALAGLNHYQDSIQALQEADTKALKVQQSAHSGLKQQLYSIRGLLEKVTDLLP